MAQSVFTELNELLNAHENIIRSLKDSSDMLKSDENKPDVLKTWNQKLLQKLHKLAINRIHPIDDNFERLLLKGRSKSERLEYHEKIVSQAEEISVSLEPHFTAITKALDYQARLILTLRNISHQVNVESSDSYSINVNIWLKIGTLVYNLLSVSCFVSLFPLVEPLLFLFNLCHLKKNFNSLEACQDINELTFKSLRQYQGFDQRQNHILQSLQKSISFDKKLLTLFFSIYKNLFSIYQKHIKTELVEYDIKMFLQIFEEVLTKNKPNLTFAQLGRKEETKEDEILVFNTKKNDVESPLNIILSLFILSPNILLCKKRESESRDTSEEFNEISDNYEVVKCILSSSVILDIGKDIKLSIHDIFHDLISFYPKKSKKHKLKKQNSSTSVNIDVKDIEKNRDVPDTTATVIVEQELELELEDFNSSKYKHILSESKASLSMFKKKYELIMAYLYKNLKCITNILQSYPELESILRLQIRYILSLSRNIYSVFMTNGRCKEEVGQTIECFNKAKIFHILNKKYDLTFEKNLKIEKAIEEVEELVLKSQQKNNDSETVLVSLGETNTSISIERISELEAALFRNEGDEQEYLTTILRTQMKEPISVDENDVNNAVINEKVEELYIKITGDMETGDILDLSAAYQVLREERKKDDPLFNDILFIVRKKMMSDKELVETVVNHSLSTASGSEAKTELFLLYEVFGKEGVIHFSQAYEKHITQTISTLSKVIKEIILVDKFKEEEIEKMKVSVDLLNTLNTTRLRYLSLSQVEDKLTGKFGNQNEFLKLLLGLYLRCSKVQNFLTKHGCTVLLQIIELMNFFEDTTIAVDVVKAVEKVWSSTLGGASDMNKEKIIDIVTKLHQRDIVIDRIPLNCV